MALGALGTARFAHAGPRRLAGLPAVFEQLEHANGGRLGVAVLDTDTGERAVHRADQRFPMCSTFKLLLVCAILRRVDRHEDSLAATVSIPTGPLLYNSPMTESHAGEAMTIGALCLSVLTRSDNTAANLLLERIGGPERYTAFARSIGDGVTRLDRMELALNESRPGDPRDTTTPAAMVGDLRRVVLGTVLSPPSRKQLTRWMEGSRTGLEDLRASLPAGWRAADKTGSNGKDTRNDVAVLWPPGRAPVLVAAFITQCNGPESKRQAMLAEIGRQISGSFA
jgi:beta-lactamase class A